MTISELKKGDLFKPLKGKASYKYIGKFGSEAEGYCYLSARANSNGKSGFYTTKDIEVSGLPL